MTALPATRQAATELVNKVVQSVVLITGGLSGDEWDTILALARKGAETVGATEAWLVEPEVPKPGALGTIRTYHVNMHGQVPPPRRCLILPPEGGEA